MKERIKVEKGYRSKLVSKKSEPQKRVFIGIPLTGVVRAEWMLARYGQVIPCNWSSNDYIQWIDQYSPLRFMVADARNLIVEEFIKKGFEWLIFIDHDVVLPPLFLVGVNNYIIEGEPPMFSGLYFTKSVPSEPLIYRGRGNGYFAKWELGDKVWVDGIPMGCTVIHRSILEVLWDESEEYVLAGRKLKRVFVTPQRVFYDPETQSFNTQTGTEDLELCSRIIRDDVLTKAGWPKYARKKYPFLIDTKLFCWHIDWNGNRYPLHNEHLMFMRAKKNGEDKIPLGQSV